MNTSLSDDKKGKECEKCKNISSSSKKQLHLTINKSKNSRRAIHFFRILCKKTKKVSIEPY